MEDFLREHIFLGIFILASISSTLLLIKAYIKKNITIVIAACTRMYLAFVGLGHLQQKSVYILFAIGIVLILLNDIISSVVFITSRKAQNDIEKLSYLNVIKHLLGKIETIVENPYVGHFTTNEMGDLEFGNAKLRETLGVKDITGKNIFNYLDLETVSKIKTNDNYFGECIITTKEGVKTRGKISCSHTENGHKTLTGSIII